jgi:hypothetical protein
VVLEQLRLARRLLKALKLLLGAATDTAAKNANSAITGAGNGFTTPKSTSTTPGVVSSISSGGDSGTGDAVFRALEGPAAAVAGACAGSVVEAMRPWYGSATATQQRLLHRHNAASSVGNHNNGGSEAGASRDGGGVDGGVKGGNSSSGGGGGGSASAFPHTARYLQHIADQQRQLTAAEPSGSDNYRSGEAFDKEASGGGVWGVGENGDKGDRVDDVYPSSSSLQQQQQQQQSFEMSQGYTLDGRRRVMGPGGLLPGDFADDDDEHDNTYGSNRSTFSSTNQQQQQQQQQQRRKQPAPQTPGEARSAIKAVASAARSLDAKATTHGTQVGAAGAAAAAAAAASGGGVRWMVPRLDDALDRVLAIMSEPAQVLLLLLLPWC